MTGKLLMHPSGAREKTWSLPSGIVLRAKSPGKPEKIGADIWNLDVLTGNPLESYKNIQSEAELDCLVNILLEKYKNFDALIDLLHS